MPLPDSNVWVAMALSKHVFHAAARAWLQGQSPAHPALFCRSTEQSFLRLLTTSAVLAPFGLPALTNKAAWAVYEGFLADERIAWTEEPQGLKSTWKQLAAVRTPSPKLWMDAYLAAFALTGGHQLVTTDKAFKHFKGLELLVLSSK